MENKGKKVSLQLFEETARNNGYEVFTPDEVASYYKEGIMKSRANELTAEEKEAFVADVMYLQKAVCADEEGKDVIRFYRPKQVEWETAADGTVMKGLEGVYRDTPENRRLNRVGQAYSPTLEFLKSLNGETEGDIMKSLGTTVRNMTTLIEKSILNERLEKSRSGTYSDTSENRRKHRVGQKYGSEKKEEEKPEKTSSNEKDPAKELEAVDKVIAAINEGKLKLPQEEIMVLIEKKNNLELAKRQAEKIHSGVKANEEKRNAAEAKETSKKINEAQKKEASKELSETDKDDLREARRKLSYLQDNEERLIKRDGKEKYDKRVKQVKEVIAKLRGEKPKESQKPEYFDRTGYKPIYRMNEEEADKFISDAKKYLSENKDAKDVEQVQDVIRKVELRKEEIKETSNEEAEVYTRIKFDDVPNSGKVNLKKYLSEKVRKGVDEKWSNIKNIPTDNLKKMEKGLVNDLNKNFEAIKKSQRAELLYSIMKVKGELEKRGKESQKKE